MMTTTTKATTGVGSTDSDLDLMRKEVRRIWGFDTLRPLQEEAIRAGVDHQDSLVVLPTGGGKSLCYQVPPLVTGRTDVVVSPLISLMKDQVDGLKSNGYPAAALHSGMSADERREVARELKAGLVRLLFVAPERLFKDAFLDFLETKVKVSAFAIDEAHCISHWGHDFRPEYRRLAELRSRFRNASFHAYTATATERVRRDIVEQLKLRRPRVLVGSFDRPNLTYRVVPRVDMRAQALDIISRHPDEAVIVYCISRKDTESLAAYLNESGVKAVAYHAGLTPDVRRRRQEDFAQERVNVITATVAFGMGIDRSNVRCVIHIATPKSIEHYQQETGRAGRDGLEAECVLLYSQGDVIRWERLIRMSAENAEAPDEVIEAAGELLREVQKFASGVTCRHRALVEYFGQSYDQPKCGACDVCLEELDSLPDSLTVAQKIISCVARVKERFGVKHIADVLCGAKTERIRKFRHDELSVYNIIQDLTKDEVVSLVYQLLDQGLLSRSDGEFPVVTLNERAMEVLRGRREVVLVRPSVKSNAQASRFDHESWAGVDRGLFDCLRELRREIAAERNVPPYQIFGDGTLRDLARRRPGSAERMRAVWGVGDLKLTDLGPRFLDAIRRYCKEAGLSLDPLVEAPVTTRRTAGALSEAKRAAFELFRKGTSIDDVAKRLDRARSTTLGYLGEFIATEAPASIDRWIEPKTQKLVASVIDELGSGPLKPLYERLNGEVSYEELRIILAHRRTLNATT